MAVLIGRAKAVWEYDAGVIQPPFPGAPQRTVKAGRVILFSSGRVMAYYEGGPRRGVETRTGATPEMVERELSVSGYRWRRVR